MKREKLFRGYEIFYCLFLFAATAFLSPFSSEANESKELKPAKAASPQSTTTSSSQVDQFSGTSIRQAKEQFHSKRPLASPDLQTNQEKAQAPFSAITGLVDLTVEDKKTTRAKVGDFVTTGDVVRTHRDSKAAIELTKKLFFSIAQRSRVRITKAILENGVIEAQLELPHGLIRSVVHKGTNLLAPKKETKFEIHTPTSVCGVRGTDFFSMFKDGKSTFVFKDGSGYGYAKNNPAMVLTIKPGQAMTVSDADAIPIIREASKAEIKRLIAETTIVSRRDKDDVKTSGKTAKSEETGAGPGEDCRTDTDCAKGYVCGPDGSCVSPFDVDDERYVDALTSREDDRRQQQVDRAAQNQLSSEKKNFSRKSLEEELDSSINTMGKPCREDWQCQADFRCDKGKCVKRLPCTADQDCENGFVCLDSQCMQQSTPPPTTPGASQPPPSQPTPPQPGVNPVPTPVLNPNSILSNWNFTGKRRDGVVRSGTIDFRSDATHMFTVKDTDNQVNGNGTGTWDLNGTWLEINFRGATSSWSGKVSGDAKRFQLDTRSGSNHGIYTFTR